MIKVKNLSMSYGRVRALDDVNFEIKQGEVVGLLGPNGAGKSTTLKILTTYIYPTSGNAYIYDKAVSDNPLETRQLIGYLPEQLPLYMDMEVAEYLQFVGKARSLYGAKLQERLDWVCHMCGLKEMFHKIIRELSKGYKQRTALAQALLHDPQIVILDEPTSGLDPHQIIEIRSLIQDLAKQGKTIIFSTHILQEVQAVTNRILILSRGQLVADGSMEQLQSKVAKRKYHLVMSSQHATPEVLSTLQTLPKVESVCKNSLNTMEEDFVITSDEDLCNTIVECLHKTNWPFIEFKRHSFSLEEIFLHLTQSQKK